MSINSMIGHENPSGNFSHMNRSELDDLLDEILGDQIFFNNFPSQQQDGNGKLQQSTLQQQNGNIQQCSSDTPQINVQTSLESRATNGADHRVTSARAPINNQAIVPMAQHRNSEGDSNSCFVNAWIRNGPETQLAAGTRSRAPSLPINYVDIDRRRRLQSVPCNDYYGQKHGSSSQCYYGQSDRFVHGLCSEDTITWLDQQKMKLQTRQENRRHLNQSNQQKQLMEELKMAQMLHAQKQSEQGLQNDPNESYTNASHMSQTLGRQGYEGGTSTQMNERLQGLNLLQSNDDNFKRNNEVCKSEKSYYVSGIERPPFTTHQTKYVFSVSSPFASHVIPSDVSPTMQQGEKVNTNPGPPTPKRVSSREAMRHSIIHDWELEQWEQESHTSFSSRSDVPERSTVPSTDTKNAAGSWNAEDHIRHIIHSSSAGYLDGPGVFNAVDASKVDSLCNMNGPTVNSNVTSVTVGNTSLNANGDSSSVNCTCAIPNSTCDAMLNGSSTSGTSSLSINSTSQSAFEPVSQCASWVDRNSSYAVQNVPFAKSGSLIPQSRPEPELLPVSASIVVTSRKSSSAMLQTSSDSAVELSSFPQMSRSLTDNALVNPSQNRLDAAVYGVNHTCPPSSSTFPSDVPSDVPFPSSSVISSSKSQSFVPYVSTSAIPLEQTLALKKNDDNHNQIVNNTGNRQLAAIAEQSSGNDGTEVISLHLIGPGMQTLEPDGDLPAVRPVTPKFPRPGMDESTSKSSKERPVSLGNQQHSGEEKLLRPATHQKLNSGARRATLAACNHRPVTGDFREEQSSCNNDLRARSADVLKEEEQMKQRMKHRRHTTVNGQELMKTKDSNGGTSSIQNSYAEADSGATAYRRTERLLSADFTVHGFNRRGSLSPGEQPRRNSRLLSDPENGLSHSRTDHLDELYDVFTTKATSETVPEDKRRETKVRKPKQKEFSLAMLDNAVAGLQASATSPVDGSSSLAIVQSPQSGKTTPGFYAGHNMHSPRTSIHPLSNEAISASNNGDAAIKTSHAPHFVRDSSKYWHKPNISRDEAIACLKDKPPGTFVIRNSNSFPGAFGLALKVAHLPPNVHSRGGDPKAELVRHFLIEPTSKGVKLKGCSTEPVFGSLAALVYQHSLTPLSLPCKLIIPDPSKLKMQDDIMTKSEVTDSEVLSQGAACVVLYINSVDMESLTGNEAINKAVTTTFAVAPAPLTTLVHFKVSSQGVTLTDTNRKLFFRRHYPVDTVTFAGIDPELRNWTWINEETKTKLNSKIFGFVARKHGSPLDNTCHIFAELDAEQPAYAIVEFIMKVMLSHG